MHLADRLWAANNLCVPLLISLLLATVSSRAVHYAGIALLFVSFAVHYAPYQIN
jgi:dolichyl-phosphate-mannose--protein O-mannosyl transferase